MQVYLKYLLNDSKYFCTLPWTHLHAYPNGAAYPCCLAKHEYPIGSMKENTIKELWNSADMKDIRKNMLAEQPSKQCTKCYEQEEHGWTSMRQSGNIHFGHHIDKVQETSADGHYDDVNMIYWDIRFSNLCNLSCRSCGSMFSSNWYDDQVALWGKPDHAKVTYAGTTKMDAYDQLVEYLPVVEQVYFAGGEPIIMEEHYRILKELDKRKMYHVRLIYNTNFTKTKFKDIDVLELWNKFDSVSIGASLDAEGKRGELMRKGTVWKDVVANRKRMLEVCPQVDFYISSTVGLINALHVPDFHRNWVEQGLLKPQDFNFNLLQFPYAQRIDLLPDVYKEKVKEKYEKHLEWLRPLDSLTRATKGFESGLDYMLRRDNSKDLQQFKDTMKKLDVIRDENMLEVFPELTELYET